MSMRKNKAMYREYGRKDGTLCKDCCNLIQVQHRGKKHYKCLYYGNTSSEASDWRLSYMGCGMHGIAFKEERIPLIEALKHREKKQADEPLEGQMQIGE